MLALASSSSLRSPHSIRAGCLPGTRRPGRQCAIPRCRRGRPFSLATGRFATTITGFFAFGFFSLAAQSGGEGVGGGGVELALPPVARRLAAAAAAPPAAAFSAEAEETATLTAPAASRRLAFFFGGFFGFVFQTVPEAGPCLGDASLQYALRKLAYSSLLAVSV